MHSDRLAGGCAREEPQEVPQQARDPVLIVSIIDRYLSECVVLQNQLQLLGVVAKFIASKCEVMKHEDIEPPSARYFAHATDDTYTKQRILHGGRGAGGSADAMLA